MRKVFLCLSGILFFMASCNKDYSIKPLPEDTATPVFSYPIASLSSTIKFISFGDTLPDLSISHGYQIQLTDTTQIILAACSGVVNKITSIAPGNNSILVKYKSNSVYSFLYSGIESTTLQLNDSIAGGVILGKIAKIGVISFQVMKHENELLCPQTFGSAGFNNAINLAIGKHNQYNAGDSVYTPCLVSSIVM